MGRLVEINNIDVTVPRNNNIVLDELSLNVGDVVQVKSPSGRGKTYFYHTLLGKTEASLELHNNDPSVFCYCPAFLPFFCETVLDELIRINAHKDKIKELIRSNLIDEGFLNSKCRNLSGGQNQLLVLLRGILSNKPVLIFDELSNAMDYELKSTVIDFLVAHHLKSGSILFSIHDSTFLSPSKIIELG